MTLRPGFALAGIAAAGLLAVAAGATMLGAARARLEAAERARAALAAQLRTIEHLRGQQERIALAERPTQDLIARINGVLRAAGLSNARFGGLATEGAPTPIPGADDRFRRQSMRATLTGLPLHELGLFLAGWESSQPAWTVSRIEMTRRAGGAGDLVDAQLTMTAVYIEPATGAAESREQRGGQRP
ncbi:MAG: hypothetical protein KDA22_04210 [Phycisphaerales bacterium]|nr:hypothetical protein [Phycisphaerales bacterium]